MLPSPDELKRALEQLLPGVSLTLEGTVLFVGPKDLAAVCRCLKEQERFGLDYLANLTAVDYPTEHLPAAPEASTSGAAQAGRMDVVYHLYSMAQKHGPVILKVKLPRANPVVASVTPIWRGAEFQEREVYDLYGVTFEGHPDLRRILMWDGFQGHPMRKDYVPEDQDA
ncbi:MAG: NADH-quinone oxidoreductase subunit C [Candidatus Omnitrophica bacterium]|nr:NADH-quinone oxidoreductase subunit C [Candidatus Omnitrophota bacterium]